MLTATLIAMLAVQDDGFPKPGKEHEGLKAFVGTWDVKMTFWMAEGQPPLESKGVCENKLELGGFWLTGTFKGEMFGKAFEGRTVWGYSPNKKKFVSTWVDNFMPHLFTAEGDVDAAGKVYSMVAESFDPATGKPVKERWVTTLENADKHVMTFHVAGEDGKERKTGEIVYTRKK